MDEFCHSQFKVSATAHSGRFVRFPMVVDARCLVLFAMLLLGLSSNSRAQMTDSLKVEATLASG